MSRRIIIAGGGTGGHIFPAIATAQALQLLDESIEILFVGAKNKMEMQKVPNAGFEIIGLDIVGFNRSHLAKNWVLPLKIIKSFFQSLRIMKEFAPDIVVGVGGYASFPMVRLAQIKNIKTVLLEQNSVAGKSNQLLGKRADKICVAYEGMQQYFDFSKIVFTGNPVRLSISQSSINKKDAVKYFELDEHKKTILIIGGSQGALSINEAIGNGLNRLVEQGIQLIWQTGTSFFSTAKAQANHLQGVFVTEFITQMENAYAVADIIISRAGAIAISELCVVAKPVIFVPFSKAADDHQTINAMKLVSQKAAHLISDQEANQKLITMAIDLIKDESVQLELSKNMERLAIKNADKIIANEILNLIR